MRDFRKFKVWEQSHALVLEMYKITSVFPTEERYGLTSQIRRACISIPTNIAEGCGKRSDKEFARYLDIAFGSASEKEYLLLLCRDLTYVDSNTHERTHNELVAIKKQLYQLIKKINEH